MKTKTKSYRNSIAIAVVMRPEGRVNFTSKRCSWNTLNTEHGDSPRLEVIYQRRILRIFSSLRRMCSRTLTKENTCPSQKLWYIHSPFRRRSRYLRNRRLERLRYFCILLFTCVFFLLTSVFHRRGKLISLLLCFFFF